MSPTETTGFESGRACQLKRGRFSNFFNLRILLYLIQIRDGLQKSFQSGTSSKVSTVCYGYKVTHSGELVIDSSEAKIVTFIFHQFMSGNSLGKISDALACMGISSPTGKATWSRETISKLLNNEKYVGDVVLNSVVNK